MADLLAPAKINLFLRVLGKRDDGYHDILSLIGFAQFGDRLSIREAAHDKTSFHGPFAAFVDAKSNSILKALDAARRAGIPLPHFEIDIEKNIPVAAGLGGGTADAGAVLRHIRENFGGEDFNWPALALQIGADAPVCLESKPALVGGIGHFVHLLSYFPRLPVLVVNPLQALSTRDVFDNLDIAALPPLSVPPQAKLQNTDDVLTVMKNYGNDLLGAAQKLMPEIGGMLAALSAMPDCRFANLSGSGASCFALFPDKKSAENAERAYRAAFPGHFAIATEIEGADLI